MNEQEHENMSRMRPWVRSKFWRRYSGGATLKRFAMHRPLCRKPGDCSSIVQSGLLRSSALLFTIKPLGRCSRDGPDNARVPQSPLLKRPMLNLESGIDTDYSVHVHTMFQHGQFNQVSRAKLIDPTEAPDL